MSWYGADLKVPMPRNKSELELLTHWYFGAPLHLSRLDIYGGSVSYEVKEDYNSYHGIARGFLFDESCTRGYDYSARFWKAVLGVLSCGGIARASYGSATIIRGHRHKKRLVALAESLRRKGPDPVRPVFVRLAAQSRGRREWRDSR